MEIIDLRKQFKASYTAKVKPEIIQVPPLNYITIAGKGDPDSENFKAAVAALYAVAYKLRFMIKQGKTSLEPFDYKVMPLEGQWFSDDYSKFTMDNKSAWQWNAMIAVPQTITMELLGEVIKAVQAKKGLPELSKLKLETLTDGLSVQLMYIGAYDDEPPTIEAIHQFAYAQGYKLTGRHREIYISDPRKTPAERLKTIIRQPIIKA
jgi:hypothetical protein